MGLFVKTLYASTTTDTSQLTGILSITRGTFNVLIPIIITLGVVYFMWAVIQYTLNKSEEERAQARNHMIYGIIGLFVVVSIWGLIGFIGNTTGVDQGGSLSLPCAGTDANNNPYDGCQ